MNQEKENDDNANAAGSIEAIDKDHASPTDQGAGSSSLPTEVVKRRPEVGRRAYLQQETCQISDQECHEIGHSDKGRDLIDVEKHRNLGCNEGHDNGVYRLISLPGPLAKDTQTR